MEEEIPEQPEDKTIPRYRQIDKVGDRTLSQIPLYITESLLTRCQRAGAYVTEWGVELEAQYQEWAQANQGTATSARLPKRPASSAKDDSEPKKKAKATETDVLTDEDMKDHFDRNAIGKVGRFFGLSHYLWDCIGVKASIDDESQLSIPVLKAWMGKKGLGFSGKKADLVENIETYFEQK